MGLGCDKFPNQVRNLKEKYNIFFQSFINLIFKGDVELFCEALLTSTPVVVDHIEKIFENFSLDVKKTKLTIVEARKLEQEKKKEIQNKIIKDLNTVNVSERNKDNILRIVKKNLPEIVFFFKKIYFNFLSTTFYFSLDISCCQMQDRLE